MYLVNKSHKLDHVGYDIRGRALTEAKRLEEEGHRILRLNIGNPAPFGFNAPEEIIRDVVVNMQNAQGYSDSQGLFAARKAVMQYCQGKGFPGVDVDDIYLGNGVSELITLSMQALLNDGDEILIPMPDYPLWTAAATLAGGRAVHYRCDEQSSWYPDMEDLEKKVSKTTKGLVIINPNNPTGSVYPREVLEELVEFARRHSLVIFADEIYDKILYDGAEHVSAASLGDDYFCVTFNGLSKAYRSAGFRAGWMVLSGPRHLGEDYIEGLTMLSNMRLCSNVPGQFAVQTALGGYQSIHDLVLPGGRLRRQRDFSYQRVEAIPGLSCVKPPGALYLFPRVDAKRFGIVDDRQFIYDFLVAEQVLLVQGTGFNWPEPDHFRIVFLPREETLGDALGRLERFLDGYRQE